jgi:signal transduction histidine kinase
VDAFNSSGTAILENPRQRARQPETIRRNHLGTLRTGTNRYDATIPGSGVGLPIARALIDAHGGTITQHRSTHLGGA